MSDHKMTKLEERMASGIENILDGLVDGQFAAIGICAVNKRGEPAFFYMNEPEESVLKPAMMKLLSLYEGNQQFRDRVTAPYTNRSYRNH